jgi:hypothetical protein
VLSTLATARNNAVDPRLVHLAERGRAQVAILIFPLLAVLVGGGVARGVGVRHDAHLLGGDVARFHVPQGDGDAAQVIGLLTCPYATISRLVAVAHDKDLVRAATATVLLAVVAVVSLTHAKAPSPAVAAAVRHAIATVSACGRASWSRHRRRPSCRSAD